MDQDSFIKFLQFLDDQNLKLNCLVFETDKGPVFFAVSDKYIIINNESLNIYLNSLNLPSLEINSRSDVINLFFEGKFNVVDDLFLEANKDFVNFDGERDFNLAQFMYIYHYYVIRSTY